MMAADVLDEYADIVRRSREVTEIVAEHGLFADLRPRTVAQKPRAARWRRFARISSS
jgi:hypothetical protein